MSTQSTAPSNVFSVLLFIVMVSAIATVAFSVMGEFGLITSSFLGIGIGVVAGIVLGLLLRRPREVPADKPVGRAPRASAGREGSVVPADDRAEGGPNTTLAAVTGGGADAGGVGRPATAAARSPLDPAEIPVAGAGGPLDAPNAEAEPSRREVAGDDHARSSDDRGPDDRGSDDRGAETVVARSRAEERPADHGRPSISAVEDEPSEGEGERKPMALEAPRAGRADDLTGIRGIGQALRDKLNGLGIYHYDQIASWTPADVRWIDRNLEGFTGRASRDDWVGQARILAERP